MLKRKYRYANKPAANIDLKENIEHVIRGLELDLFAGIIENCAK